MGSGESLSKCSTTATGSLHESFFRNRGDDGLDDDDDKSLQKGQKPLWQAGREEDRWVGGGGGTMLFGPVSLVVFRNIVVVNGVAGGHNGHKISTTLHERKPRMDNGRMCQMDESSWAGHKVLSPHFIPLCWGEMQSVGTGFTLLMETYFLRERCEFYRKFMTCD